MRVQIIPSSVGGRPPRHCLSCYVVNGSVAVDAGSLGLLLPLAAQKRVRHVFLTHAHLDHVATLPQFLDNVYRTHPDGVQVYGLPHTLDSLRGDLFNDRVWPDFVRLSGALSPPFIRLHELTPGVPVVADGLTLTPVPVDHPVPTVAFVIAGADAACAIVTDTRPTAAVWALCRQLRVQGVFLEASFPDDHAELAHISGHLTPSLFRAEIEKIDPDVPVVAVHLKPAFHGQVARELRALKQRRVKVGVPGRVYRFGV